MGGGRKGGTLFRGRETKKRGFWGEMKFNYLFNVFLGLFLFFLRSVLIFKKYSNIIKIFYFFYRLKSFFCWYSLYIIYIYIFYFLYKYIFL